jgi:type I restriction enzyme S subunit
MSNDWFFEKFALIADAPGAVDRMRELVLEFAVQGHLLTGTNRWETHPLKSLATKIGSGATPSGGSESYFKEGIPLIRSMNIHFRGFNETGLVFLSDEQADKLSNVAVQPNDVLLNITGASIGRVTIAPHRMDGARVNQHVTIIRPTPDLSPRFLAIFLASPNVQRMINEIQIGATRQALTKGMIEHFEIPLPPLAEQKRIVAKVDELMGLCDELEVQQQERELRKSVLIRSSLSRFAESPTRENLGYLFHNSYDIPPSELRKSILTLAVQGKLVPQEPEDEPAAVVLAKITNLKIDSLNKKARIRPNTAVNLPDVQLPFTIPTGWEWTTLAFISRCIQYGYTASANENIRAVRLLRITDIQDNNVDWDSVPGCEILASEIPQYRLECGDILVARTGGTVGKTFLVRDVPVIAVFASYLIRIQVNPMICYRYLKVFLESPPYWAQLLDGARGAAQPNVNGQTLGRMVVSLPPLAEQHRIVAKVDQLMSLVDELERQQAASREKASNLLDAIVHEMTSGG